MRERVIARRHIPRLDRARHWHCVLGCAAHLDYRRCARQVHKVPEGARRGFQPSQALCRVDTVISVHEDKQRGAAGRAGAHRSPLARTAALPKANTALREAQVAI